MVKVSFPELITFMMIKNYLCVLFNNNFKNSYSTDDTEVTYVIKQLLHSLTHRWLHVNSYTTRFLVWKLLNIEHTH